MVSNMNYQTHYIFESNNIYLCVIAAKLSSVAVKSPFADTFWRIWNYFEGKTSSFSGWLVSCFGDVACGISAVCVDHCCASAFPKASANLTAPSDSGSTRKSPFGDSCEMVGLQPDNELIISDPLKLLANQSASGVVQLDSVA